MTDVTPDVSVLKNILVNIVTEPENVYIERAVDELGVLVSVRVAAKDMGIVIGREAVMVNALKTIMKVVGKSNGMNIRLQIQEPDGSVKYSANPRQNRDYEESTNQSRQEPVQNISTDEDLTEFPIN